MTQGWAADRSISLLDTSSHPPQTVLLLSAFLSSLSVFFAVHLFAHSHQLSLCQTRVLRSTAFFVHNYFVLVLLYLLTHSHQLPLFQTILLFSFCLPSFFCPFDGSFIRAFTPAPRVLDDTPSCVCPSFCPSFPSLCVILMVHSFAHLQQLPLIQTILLLLAFLPSIFVLSVCCLPIRHLLSPI